MAVKFVELEGTPGTFLSILFSAPTQEEEHFSRLSISKDDEKVVPLAIMN